MTTFRELDLIEPLLENLVAAGYEVPTPIQQQAIQPLLAGRDLLGCAQTGTGKTAAFALPLLQYLVSPLDRPVRRACRALIVTPTRELAVQIGDCLRTYGRGLKLRHTLVYGGVGAGPQINALAGGVDIVVATPGRLLDLHRSGHLRLDRVEVLILDEADRMLDMGFIHDIRRILAVVPERRQTMLFSATMEHEARRLADGILREPVQVSVAPSATPIELVEQQLVHVDRSSKRARLEELLEDDAAAKVLVFCRTKHGSNRLCEQLDRSGHRAAAIHGNKSQAARQRALRAFTDGSARILVATDVAARGLDVEGITHVVNFDLPVEPEAYVHRIGRTGRAGATGVAVSFCSEEERDLLRDIEALTRRRIPVVGPGPRGDSRTSPNPPRSASQPQRHRGSRSRRAAAGD